MHVDGLSEPLVASRSERAILADVESALAEAAGIPRRADRREGAGEPAVGRRGPGWSVATRAVAWQKWGGGGVRRA